LKNELSPYNVNLSAHLLHRPSSVEFEKVLPIIKKYTRRLHAPSLVKKEQARFYIKIFLWDIESIHGQHPVLHQDNQGPDQNTYIALKNF
jgi:AraC family transcriptional activator of pobA